MQPLAEITGGHVSSVNRVQQLSRSFFVEVMISNTRNEGINDDIKNNRQEIAAIARSCPNGQELTEDEMVTINPIIKCFKIRIIVKLKIYPLYLVPTFSLYFKLTLR